MMWLLLLIRRLRKADDRATCLDPRKLIQWWAWDNANDRETATLYALVQAYLDGYAVGEGAAAYDVMVIRLAEWLGVDGFDVMDLLDEMEGD